MDVKEEQILGPDIARHWYYVSKGSALKYFLRHVRNARLLDVGAGSGIFSRQLIEAGICDRATCVDPAYTEVREETHNDHKISFVRQLQNQQHDLLLMMDVLEHVEDDVELLRQYSETLPPGGWTLITVPAFQFLWSGHDVFLEHKRRYTLSQIEDVVSRSGLEVVRTRYFFGLLFPVVVLVRLYAARRLRKGGLVPQSDLRKSSRWVSAGLSLIHEIERATLFRFNKWAGLTIFCLAQRR